MTIASLVLLSSLYRTGVIMNRVERFLKHLKDGKWHKTVPKQTGVRVVEALVYLQLVRKKLVPISKNLECGWRGLFQITKKGKQMLRLKLFSNREELSQAIYKTTHRSGGGTGLF